MALGLRNVGTGIAVLHGRHVFPERVYENATPTPLEDFTRLSRDVYVHAGDVGSWQGSFRDPASPAFAEAVGPLTARNPVMIDLLYGDHEGGQRVITRFSLMPLGNGGWIATAGRYWNVDRAEPR